jgi:hypothetical protein
MHFIRESRFKIGCKNIQFSTIQSLKTAYHSHRYSLCPDGKFIILMREWNRNLDTPPPGHTWGICLFSILRRREFNFFFLWKVGNLFRGSGIWIFLLNTCAESKMASMDEFKCKKTALNDWREFLKEKKLCNSKITKCCSFHFVHGVGYLNSNFSQYVVYLNGNYKYM